MEWKTIETAPKDGTRILVVNRDEGYDKEVGYRTYSSDIGVASWEKGLGLSMGWISTSCCDGVSCFEPTHWMPLPKPPMK